MAVSLYFNILVCFLMLIRFNVETVYYAENITTIL